MKSLRTSLVLLAAIGIIFVAGSIARAGTVYTSVTSGNDSAAATWDQGVGSPSLIDDTAVISAGTTVTVTYGGFKSYYFPTNTDPAKGGPAGLPYAAIQGTGTLKYTGTCNNWPNVSGFQGIFQYHTSNQKLSGAGQGIQYGVPAGNDFLQATLYLDNAFALGSYADSGFKWAGWTGNGAIETHDNAIHMVISGSIAPSAGSANGGAAGTGTLTFCGWGGKDYTATIELGSGGAMSFKVLGDGTSVTGSDLVQTSVMNFGGSNTINVALPATATAITNLPLVSAGLLTYDTTTNAPGAVVGTNKIVNWSNVNFVSFTNTSGYESYSLSLSADGNQVLLNTTVPEPATLGLLLIGGLAVIRRNRR